MDIVFSKVIWLKTIINEYKWITSIVVLFVVSGMIFGVAKLSKNIKAKRLFKIKLYTSIIRS